jgi:hypothetical protein
LALKAQPGIGTLLTLFGWAYTCLCIGSNPAAMALKQKKPAKPAFLRLDYY